MKHLVVGNAAIDEIVAENGKKKQLIVGNAAIDGIIGKKVHVKIGKYNVTLNYNGHRLKIPVEKGPIHSGGKFTATIDFYQKVHDMSRIEQFGGGGYLSSTVLRKISEHELFYLDISTPSLDTSVPGKSLADRLQSMNTNPYFLSARPLPFNIVIGKREDKIIIKSRLGTTTFGEYHAYLVNALTKSCDAMLFNSLKDEGLVDLLMKSPKKTKVGVITSSLDPDYLLEKVIPNCICQFNYDEFGYVVNPDHKVKGDENTRIESAVESIKRIRKDYNQHDHIYITLGKNGVLCSDNSKVYHLKLKDRVLEEIQKVVIENPASTCGAGDAFGTGATWALLQGFSLPEALRAGSINAASVVGTIGAQAGLLTNTDMKQRLISESLHVDEV